MLLRNSRARLLALSLALPALAVAACDKSPDAGEDSESDAGFAGELNASGGGSTSGGTFANGGSPAGGSLSSSGGSAADGGGAPIGGAGEPPSPFGPVDCSEPSGTLPALTLKPVVEGLEGPIFVDHVPGDDRLFIVLAGGTVHIFEDGQLSEEPFLDLGNKLTTGSERGLLGFAFHPAYADNGLFYVHYSAGPGAEGTAVGDTVLEEYQVSTDPGRADPASARVVLTLSQPYANHNGGTITFGPDGFLYMGLGDGGSGGDPQGHGQNPDLLASLLRIDPTENGANPYSVPDDNYPGAAPEVFSIGLRNPFRFTFDGCLGDLYIGDVGQDEWEEIDYLKAGQSGKNFGWNIMEGNHCFKPESDCDTDGLVLPISEHPHSEAKSITGGSVYRGSSIPALRGAYFYADYSNNRVWWLRVDRETGEATAPTSVTQDLNARSIVAIESGPDGELYFVSIGGRGDTPTPGAVYRLEASE
jgi:glucose/arabinose dehydrogenase